VVERCETGHSSRPEGENKINKPKQGGGTINDWAAIAELSGREGKGVAGPPERITREKV